MERDDPLVSTATDFIKQLNPFLTGKTKLAEDATDKQVFEQLGVFTGILRSIAKDLAGVLGACG